MTKGQQHQEKLMKLFWMRPAFHKQSLLGSKWYTKSFNNNAKLTSTLIVFFSFFFLFIFLSFFGSRMNLAKKLNATQKPPKTIFKKPTHTDYPLDCKTWNHSNTCPQSYPKNAISSASSSQSTCPEYFRWIHEDLRHWKQTGITKKMVENGRKPAHFRLIILDGKMYVEKFRESIQTRAIFTMWGFVQLMRWYPGKLPDLELLFDCDDRPLVQARHYRNPGSDPPPLFRYCSDWKSLDIVFPDWSFWGWPETNIKPWRNVLKDIKEGNKKIKWEDRVPYAYWRGNPHVCPWRGDLMKCNVSDKNDWNTRLYVQDWNEESKVGYKKSNLEDQCTHKYKIYIEGWAWSVSEKYIFACDSPVLLMTLRWYTFFNRGMIPQHHYWPVQDNDKCKSLKFAVEWGNNHTEKAKAIGEAGSRFIHEDMKMEYIYDYMFHLLNEYAKLFKYKPTLPPNAVELCSKSLACPSYEIWRKDMEESLEKIPGDSAPCKMPPPFNPQEFKNFYDEKNKATKEVEAWEFEYWDKQNKKQ